jgi:hypothetical protein
VAAEEELGQCCPTVFQVNIMAILLNAVRVWRNNQHSILHKSSTRASFIVCTYYILSMHRVYTGLYLVCTRCWCKIILSAADLRVGGMEVLL